MNLGAGFRAAGEGLELIAKNAMRREENDWQAMREENLARIRHEYSLQEEGVRADNVRQENDADRRWRTSEAAKGRRADDQRQNRADDRADKRQSRADHKQDSRDLNAAWQHRTTTLQAFRQQYGKALDDYNSAKASGVADEKDLAEMAANVQYIAREMQNFDAESTERLANLGDSTAKAKMLSDEDMDKLAGGKGGDKGAPGAAAAPAAGGSARPKPKPKSRSLTDGPLRDTTNPRPNPLTGMGAVADWAGSVDAASETQRRLEEQRLRDEQYQRYAGKPTREQLAGAGHSAPRLIP